MDTSKIKEIIEIDHGDNLTCVNERLKEEWVLLRIRIYTKKESDDVTVKNAIYILGRPSA